MQDSGRDINDNWVPETPQAKLRNKLSPFWTLTDILSNEDKFQKILATDGGIPLLHSLIQTCQDNKAIILELIKQTEANEV